MTDPSTHLFWITSRSAGTVAMVLASASVGLGLSMGGRLVKRGAVSRRTLHEALSLAVMVAVVVHALALLGDSYLRPTIFDLTVPFVSSYNTVWTSVGIIAGWGLIFLGLSYYLRGRIGVSRWRILHRFTLLAWILGLGHSLGEGTDAGQTWFLALIGITALPAIAALGWRVGKQARRPSFPGRRAAAPRGAPRIHSA